MFSLMANCFTWIKRRREPIKKVTLLMVGLDNAGKTSTVADLKGDTLDGITPTVGFLSSSISLYRFNVTLFDLGGGPRIRAIWKNYFPEVFGLVFVVDSSDRQRLDECRDALHETVNNSKICGKPILILANKQDITGAMDEDEVYHSLDIGALIARNKCPCQVLSCSALLGQGNKIDRQIKKGFQWLLSEISKNFTLLSQRVERESAEHSRILAEQRKKKFERVRKEREAREKAESEAAEKAAKQGKDSDDEDLVIGKNSRKKSPSSAPSTPVKEKKKRKGEKKTVTGETSPEPAPLNDTSVEDSNTPPHRLRPLGEPEDKIQRKGKLEPLDASQQSLNEDNENKKKKKKKKRRSNKTVPIDDETDGQDKVSSALAWGTPPSTLNGFAGTGGRASPRRLEPLPHNLFTESRISGSTIPEHEEENESQPLAPIRSNKAWTRTRPNSEDHEVMT